MDKYDVHEMNSLGDQEMPAHDARVIYWDYPGLYVYRLRLLSDPGYPEWDVKYCYGRLDTGELVRVDLPFSQLKKHLPLKEQIVRFASADGVFAKKLGILDNISTLN